MARPSLEKLESEKVVKTREEIYRWWEKDSGSKLVMMEQAYKLDATDEEACLYSDITPDQLYYFQEKIDPTFRARKHQWKQNPVLVARQSVMKAIPRDPDLALRYLERKRKSEFSLRSELEHSGEIAVPILGGTSRGGQIALPGNDSNQEVKTLNEKIEISARRNSSIKDDLDTIDID